MENDVTNNTTDTNTLQWYAFYTAARAEKKVAERIADLGFESYVPLRRKLHKWSDRAKWVETPLINSYVFVKTDKPIDLLYRNISGLVLCIKFGGKPAVITEQEIDAMKKFVQSEHDVVVWNTNQLKQGARVKIIAGSEAGYEGVLVSDCKDGNFAVNINGISMSLVVEMAQDMLEVIPEKKEPKKKKYNL